MIAVSIVAFVLLRRRNQKVKFTKKETDALKVELFGDGVEPDVEGSQDTNTDLTNTKVEVDYSLKKQNIAGSFRNSKFEFLIIQYIFRMVLKSLIFCSIQKPIFGEGKLQRGLQRRFNLWK